MENLANCQMVIRESIRLKNKTGKIFRSVGDSTFIEGLCDRSKERESKTFLCGSRYWMTPQLNNSQ